MNPKIILVLTQLLHVSVRSLQRYRSLRILPNKMMHKKACYTKEGVLQFIKKLTYQNPTMKAAFKRAESKADFDSSEREQSRSEGKAKFDEARKNGQDKDIPIPENKDDTNIPNGPGDDELSAKIGDRIIYEYRYCTVVDKKTENGSPMLVVRYDSGQTDIVEENNCKYTISKDTRR